MKTSYKTLGQINPFNIRNKISYKWLPLAQGLFKIVKKNMTIVPHATKLLLLNNIKFTNALVTGTICGHGKKRELIVSQISVHCCTVAGHYSYFWKTLHIEQLGNFHKDHLFWEMAITSSQSKVMERYFALAKFKYNFGQWVRFWQL